MPTYSHKDRKTIIGAKRACPTEDAYAVKRTARAAKVELVCAKCERRFPCKDDVEHHRCKKVPEMKSVMHFFEKRVMSRFACATDWSVQQQQRQPKRVPREDDFDINNDDDDGDVQTPPATQILETRPPTPVHEECVVAELEAPPQPVVPLQPVHAEAAAVVVEPLPEIPVMEAAPAQPAIVNPIDITFPARVMQEARKAAERHEESAKKVDYYAPLIAHHKATALAQETALRAERDRALQSYRTTFEQREADLEAQIAALKKAKLTALQKEEAELRAKIEVQYVESVNKLEAETKAKLAPIIYDWAMAAHDVLRAMK